MRFVQFQEITRAIIILVVVVSSILRFIMGRWIQLLGAREMTHRIDVDGFSIYLLERWMANMCRWWKERVNSNDKKQYTLISARSHRITDIQIIWNIFCLTKRNNIHIGNVWLLTKAAIHCSIRFLFHGTLFLCFKYRIAVFTANKRRLNTAI